MYVNESSNASISYVCSRPYGYVDRTRTVWTIRVYLNGRTMVGVNELDQVSIWTKYA